MFHSFILNLIFIVTSLTGLILVYLRNAICLDCWLILWLWGTTIAIEGATITTTGAIVDEIVILKLKMVRYQFITNAIKCSTQVFYACLQYFLQYLCHAVILKRNEDRLDRHNFQAKNGKISVYLHYQILTQDFLHPRSVFSLISSSCSCFEKGRGTSSDGELYQLIADASFNVPSALHASPLGFVGSLLIEVSSMGFSIDFWLILFYWHVKEGGKTELLTFLTLTPISLHLAHSCRVIKATWMFGWLRNVHYAHDECWIDFVPFTMGWHGWQGFRIESE